MTALNESGKPDPEQFAGLSRSFEFQREQAAKHAVAQQTALDQAKSLHLRFLTELLPSMKVIGMKTMTLSIEIRREFDVDSDSVAMEAELRAQWKRMDESVDSLLRGLSEA